MQPHELAPYSLRVGGATQLSTREQANGNRTRIRYIYVEYHRRDARRVSDMLTKIMLTAIGKVSLESVPNGGEGSQISSMYIFLAAIRCHAKRRESSRKTLVIRRLVE